MQTLLPQRFTRGITTLALVVFALVAGTQAANASTPLPGEAIASAIPLADHTAASGSILDGTKPVFYRISARLVEHTMLTLIPIQTASTHVVTLRLFRPGVTDQNLTIATPFTEISATSVRKEASFVADWPGTWIIEVSSAGPVGFQVAAAHLPPEPSTAPISGSTTVTHAAGMIVNQAYQGTTYAPTTTNHLTPRYERVEVETPGRIRIALASTNGVPIRADIFEPGATDATVDTAASLASTTTSTATTLVVNAPRTGAWIVRVRSVPHAHGAIEPATYTATLAPITDSIVAACANDITNIGLIRIQGCVESDHGSYRIRGEASFSGVLFEPNNGATLLIDPKTLEVTSAGTFDVVLLGVKVLTATNYFVFKGTQTVVIPKDSSVYGMPINGNATLHWSLKDGGSASVIAEARLTKLGIAGMLSGEVSIDKGVSHLGVMMNVSNFHGLAFGGRLKYTEEIVGLESVSVWRMNMDLAVLPPPPPAKVTTPPTPTSTTPTDTPATDQTPTKTPVDDKTKNAAGLIGAAGTIEFRDGELAFIHASVAARLPIGTTGLFLTQAGLAARFKPYFMLSGTGTIAAGPDVLGAPILKIDGQAGFATGGSCPNAPTSGFRWFGSGEAMIANWFTVASLNACYQAAAEPYVIVTGNSHFNAEGIIQGNVNLTGTIVGTRAIQLEGEGQLSIFNSAGVHGRLVLSDYGAAACATADVSFLGMIRRIEFGAERRWTDKTGTYGFACPDFAPYRTALARRSVRTVGDWPVGVPADTKQVQIVVHGTAGSVPGVDIVDPSGAIVAQSTSVSTPTMSGALFLPEAKTGRMLIALPVNKAGTYIVRAQAGSVIASVETSLPLHNVTIKARVTQTNRTSILTYRLGSLEGRTVQFWDTSRGVARRIGKTSKTNGVIRFRQEGNPKARHTITAIITNHGYAMPRRIVTRFSQSNSDMLN
ncbi:MAG: hypothetical protein WCP81_07945 [Actinomycetes bacterium]